jgi:hypothetical protein
VGCWGKRGGARAEQEVAGGGRASAFSSEGGRRQPEEGGGASTFSSSGLSRQPEEGGGAEAGGRRPARRRAVVVVQ